MLIGQCRWAVGARNVHVQSSVIGNILSPIVVNISTRKVWVVESVVLVSWSSRLRKSFRCVSELFVEILRCSSVVAVGEVRWRAEASCERRDKLHNITFLHQLEVQTSTAFWEIEVLDLCKLSFRLFAFIQVEGSEIAWDAQLRLSCL